jgi:hypothetical protein
MTRPIHRVNRACRLHLSEQYLTSSQQRCHFFRHVKGRLQYMHIFSGKCCFFMFLQLI